MAALVAIAAFAQESRFDAGLALYRAGRLQEALVAFKASEEAGEAKPVRGFYQGVCLAKLGDFAAASTSLLAYVSAQPADPHGWYWLGRAQLLGKRFEEARHSVQRAIELDSQAFESYRTLGEIEIQLQNNDAAYRAWISANRLNPKDAQTAYYLGRLFFEADVVDEAARWLGEALRLAPAHFAAMTYLGLCAEHRGDNDTASRLYLEAMRQSRMQNAPYAWAFLSYAKLLRQSGNETEALSVLEQAEKECPEAHALALLGQLLAARRVPERAESVLRRAIEMDSDIPEAHYRLSLLLRSEGRLDEARKEMNRFQEAKKLEDRTKNKIAAIRR